MRVFLVCLVCTLFAFNVVAISDDCDNGCPDPFASCVDGVCRCSAGFIGPGYNEESIVSALNYSESEFDSSVGNEVEGNGWNNESFVETTALFNAEFNEVYNAEFNAVYNAEFNAVYNATFNATFNATPLIIWAEDPPFLEAPSVSEVQYSSYSSWVRIYDVPYEGHVYSAVHRGEAVGTGPHSTGGLDSGDCWHAPLGSRNQWMQLQAGENDTWVVGVATKGRPNTVFSGWSIYQYVSSFRVETRMQHNETWEVVGVFTGNSDRNTLVESVFRRPVLAYYVRIYPLTWRDQASMRAGLLLLDGCLDVDECAESSERGVDACVNAICSNTVGSFNCVCEEEGAVYSSEGCFFPVIEAPTSENANDGTFDVTFEYDPLDASDASGAARAAVGPLSLSMCSVFSLSMCALYSLSS